MLRNNLLALIFAGAMAVSSANAADLIVKVAPPRIVVEKRAPRPGRDYVWQAGYHRWDGNLYVWETGRWEKAPRAHARWIAPRWQHRRDGWLFIEGHWA